LKLGKIEKKVLVALLKPSELGKKLNLFFEKHYYRYHAFFMNKPKEDEKLDCGAKTMYDIAGIVYGEGVLDPYRNLSLTRTAKASLTRALKNLYRKGLVKIAKPIFKCRWFDVKRARELFEDDEAVGFMERKIEELKIYENGNIVNYYYNGPPWGISGVFPDRCRRIYMLTKSGREVALKLALENPKLDEMIGFYVKKLKEEEKRRIEENKKRCMERCIHWMKELHQCSFVEMEGKEFITNECKYFRDKEWGYLLHEEDEYY